MKRIVPILLVVLFAFNLAGYYIAFPVVSLCFKGVVRTGMEANVFEKKLVLIKIPPSVVKTTGPEFQMTDDDEFQYKGSMYDVSEKKVIGDTVYFYCYSDKDEDQLLAGLNDHINSDSATYPGSGKPGNHDFVKKPLKVYVKSAMNQQATLQTSHKTSGSTICLLYLSIDQDFDDHPPEHIV